TRVDVQNGNFQVLELGGDQIDASGMTNFRFDLYFPNPQVGTEQFLLKLVDIGAATSEAQLFINSSSTPAIDQGTWLSFDYELASLSSLAGTSNIQQVVIDLLTANDVGEVYIDNIYFYDASATPPGPVPPTVPAPDPTEAAADVISIYSDSYTDNPNQGFNLYGAAAFEEVDVAGSGNSALKYTRVDVQNGNFQVLELGGDQIDASGMTNFRFEGRHRAVPAQARRHRRRHVRGPALHQQLEHAGHRSGHLALLRLRARQPLQPRGHQQHPAGRHRPPHRQRRR
ncbi:MAG: hypothetical protein AMS19_14435, partial [Gemmatimonas sp. SG8_23]